MAAAAALSEVIGLRMIYVAAGVTVGAAGLVGLFVLQEPDLQAIGSGLGEMAEVTVEAASD